jgi:thiosulfate dehydrogenase [quinone] large subunit
MAQVIIKEAPVSRYVFSNTAFAWFWGVIRIYVGWQWLVAGIDKFSNPAWNGEGAGTALSGFIQGALTKTGGAHPDVSGWYASFLQNVVLPHAATWSHIVTYGEILVGAALIIGLLTGIAAFFGLFMNLNFLFAGAVSVNPLLFVLSIGIMLAWKIAGYIGVDRFLLPKLGTPWESPILMSNNKY